MCWLQQVCKRHRTNHLLSLHQQWRTWDWSVNNSFNVICNAPCYYVILRYYSQRWIQHVQTVHFLLHMPSPTLYPCLWASSPFPSLQFQLRDSSLAYWQFIGQLLSREGDGQREGIVLHAHNLTTSVSLWNREKKTNCGSHVQTGPWFVFCIPSTHIYTHIHTSTHIPCCCFRWRIY